MLIFDDGQRQAGLIAGIRFVAMRAFHNIPAIVLAPWAGGSLMIDLLVPILAYIANVEIAGEPVK